MLSAFIINSKLTANIFEAVRNNDLNLVEQILQNDRSKISEKDNSENTPLHYAVEARNEEMVTTLLSYDNASYKIKNKRGTTPLRMAIRLKKIEIVKLFLTNPTQIREKFDSGQTVLHYASQLKRRDIVTFLLQQGADVNEKDDRGNTALHYAVKSGGKATVKILLDNGANPNEKNDAGNTPLHTAIKLGSNATVRLLLENGANPNEKNNYIDRWFFYDTGVRTPLHYAAMQENIGKAKLLLDNGANPNEKTRCGKTPLHDAISYQRTMMVELLLQKGSNWNEKDDSGTTPLEYAQKNNQQEIINLLLEKENSFEEPVVTTTETENPETDTNQSEEVITIKENPKGKRNETNARPTRPVPPAPNSRKKEVITIKENTKRKREETDQKNRNENSLTANRSTASPAPNNTLITEENDIREELRRCEIARRNRMRNKGTKKQRSYFVRKRNNILTYGAFRKTEEKKLKQKKEEKENKATNLQVKQQKELLDTLSKKQQEQVPATCKNINNDKPSNNSSEKNEKEKTEKKENEMVNLQTKQQKKPSKGLKRPRAHKKPKLVGKHKKIINNKLSNVNLKRKNPSRKKNLDKKNKKTPKNTQIQKQGFWANAAKKINIFRRSSSIEEMEPTEKESNLNKEDHKNNSNISYITINTVNQAENRVNHPVVEKYMESSIFNSDYAPGATCGSLSIRNADLLSRFLETKDNNILDQIANEEDASQYLKGVIESDEATSWLRSNTIKRRIEILNKTDKITVLDSVKEIEIENKSLNPIINNFRNLENYSHVFIVSTSELYAELCDSIGKLEKEKEGATLSKKNVNFLLKREEAKTHWYVIAIEKNAEEKNITCYTIDTIPSNDHTTGLLFSRAQYFCERILGEASTDNFSPMIQKYTLEQASKFFPHLVPQEHKPIKDELAEIVKSCLHPEIDEFIKQHQHPDEYRNLPRLIVLHGPNGTGKSTIAKLIAREIDRKLIFIDSGLIGNEYQSSSENQLRLIVNGLAAKKRPYAIVFDEADCLTKRGGDNFSKQNNLSGAIAGILSAHKDNENLLFIWTTNDYPGIGDKFLSRIVLDVEVQLPNQPNREKMIRYLLEKNNPPKRGAVFDASFCEWVSKRTNGWSIRDLESLISRSVNRTITKKRESKQKTGKVSLNDKTFYDGFYKVYDNIEKKRTIKQKSAFEKTEEFVKKYNGTINLAVNCASTAASIANSNAATNKSLAQNEKHFQESKKQAEETLTENRQNTRTSKWQWGGNLALSAASLAWTIGSTIYKYKTGKK